MYLIGLDIGTTTISAVLTERDTGELIKAVTLKNDAFITSSFDFERTQDPEVIFTTVKHALSQLSEYTEKVCAIGVTGQMHGIVYCDENGKHISPLYTWQDGRGNESYNDTTYCSYINEKTGYKTASGFGLVTHFYNTVNGLVPKDAYKLCTIHDYMVMRLCCINAPLMHSSDGASFGLYDLTLNRFVMDALKMLGIDTNIIPDMTAKTVFAGKTAIDFLPTGIPVTVAIGDNQASFLGAVKSHSDTILVNMGTGSQVSVMTVKAVDLPVGEIRPFLEGSYLFVGSSLCGGRAYQILEDFFKNCAVFFGLEPQKTENLFPIMDKLSDNVFSLSNPLKIGCEFCGTREEPDKRGKIENLSAFNFTPEHFICGVLNGTVSELYNMYDKCRPFLTAEPIRLMGSGNGIRKSKVWRKLFEEQFNMALTVSENKEEAAYGAAVFALKALG